MKIDDGSNVEIFAIKSKLYRSSVIHFMIGILLSILLYYFDTAFEAKEKLYFVNLDIKTSKELLSLLKYLTIVFAIIFIIGPILQVTILKDKILKKYIISGLGIFLSDENRTIRWDDVTNIFSNKFGKLVYVRHKQGNRSKLITIRPDIMNLTRDEIISTLNAYRNQSSSSRHTQ